jgi:hypothetical protein
MRGHIRVGRHIAELDTWESRFREAFDTYYARTGAVMMLTRVDGSARIGVKIV